MSNETREKRIEKAKKEKIEWQKKREEEATKKEKKKQSEEKRKQDAERKERKRVFLEEEREFIEGVRKRRRQERAVMEKEEWTKKMEERRREAIADKYYSLRYPIRKKGWYGTNNRNNKIDESRLRIEQIRRGRAEEEDEIHFSNTRMMVRHAPHENENEASKGCLSELPSLQI